LGLKGLNCGDPYFRSSPPKREGRLPEDLVEMESAQKPCLEIWACYRAKTSLIVGKMESEAARRSGIMLTSINLILEIEIFFSYLKVLRYFCSSVIIFGGQQNEVGYTEREAYCVKWHSKIIILKGFIQFTVY
jgi:hypothetical protein